MITEQTASVVEIALAHIQVGRNGYALKDFDIAGLARHLDQRILRAPLVAASAPSPTAATTHSSTGDAIDNPDAPDRKHDQEQGPSPTPGSIPNSITGVTVTTSTQSPPTPTPVAVHNSITFVSDRDGNTDIYLMNTDGTLQQRLTTSPGVDIYPSWSPNGSKIAFASNRDNNEAGVSFELYAMNADGTGQTRLTSGGGRDASSAWSPDGSRIAFQTDNQIVVMNVDGTGLLYGGKRAEEGFAVETRLTSSCCNQSPSWAPDGSRMAFTSGGGKADDIFVLNTEGKNQVRLTESPGIDRHPAWSPDGSQIAFQSDRDGNFEIYVMEAYGTRQRRLTNNSSHDRMATWSPDGSEIAFTSERDGNSEIYVMNADGTNQTRLTRNDAFDGYPIWSPQ